MKKKNLIKLLSMIETKNIDYINILQYIKLSNKNIKIEKKKSNDNKINEQKK